MARNPPEDKPSRRLPLRFEALVHKMPPQAISDENHYASTLEMIDRLMARPKLSEGQALYLETLVQLVQAYESREHAIDHSGLDGRAMLQHLLAEHGLNAAGLAHLLGVHVSMGSKILSGERALTVTHMRKLGRRFRVSPGLFID